MRFSAEEIRGAIQGLAEIDYWVSSAMYSLELFRNICKERPVEWVRGDGLGRYIAAHEPLLEAGEAEYKVARNCQRSAYSARRLLLALEAEVTVAEAEGKK